MNGRDRFPTTARAWIKECLASGDGARREVNRHVMAVYADPLRAYVACTPFRCLGDVAELVSGFFADRLARPEFLAGWAESDGRLRRWLLNALGYYLRETARRERRHVSTELPAELVGESSAAVGAAERAFARSVVHNALELARAELAREGMQRHFQAFYAHCVEERAYADIGVDLGLAQDRVRRMSRTGMSRFRRLLEGALRRDGVAAEDIDSEVAVLMERLQ